MKKIFLEGSTYGKLIFYIGCLVIFPIVTIPFYKEDSKYFFDFFIPGSISIILGLIIIFLKKEKKYEEWKKELRFNNFTVIFAWLWASVLGSLPFISSKILKPLHAIFESVSGWTTTGLSVVDVTNLPHIFLFHRSFMQFCGGLGFILMMIMLVNNRNSMGLYTAEGHSDKIYGNLKTTTRFIFFMYTSLLFIGTILYSLFGMSIFDSINNSMCALSTGGFAIKLQSIGEYNSFKIEMVTIILMFIGTTNFASLELLFKGKIKNFFRISEVKFTIIMLFFFIPITAFGLYYSKSYGFIESSRIALFDLTSAISTTGFSTVSYDNFPPFVLGIFIICMIIGGGAGSTAGGLKLIRAYFLLKIAFKNIKEKISPSTSVYVLPYKKANGKFYIDSEQISEICGFTTVYLISLVIGSLIISLTENVSLTHSMFEFTSSLSTVGLSVGITSPNAKDTTLIVEIVGMLLGRLEIFILFATIYSAYTKLKNIPKQYSAN